VGSGKPGNSLPCLALAASKADRATAARPPDLTPIDCFVDIVVNDS